MIGAWLLDLEIGGRVYRYATRAVVVTAALEGELAYAAGLTDFDLALDGMLEDQGFQVLDRGVNWARLVSRGVPLDGSRAVLRWWDGEAVLEQARVVLDGIVTAAEYGDPEQPGSLVASIASSGRDLYYPGPQASVSPTTFAYDPVTPTEYFDDAIGGAVYPTVLGYPGYNETLDTIGSLIPATPVLLVKYNGLTGTGNSHLLACFGVCEAANVLLTDASDEFTSGGYTTYATELSPVGQTTDLLGQQYSFMEFDSGAPPPDPNPVPGHRYYAAWSPSASRGGGLLRPGRDAPVRSLTDVLLFALRYSGRRVDLQAQETQRDDLDLFNVDGFINAQVQLLPWVESNLVPLFPLARVTGPRGVWYRFVDWAAPSTSARRHIDADGGRARRASAVQTVRDQLANVFTLDYARHAITGAYFGRRTLAPEDGLLPAGLFSNVGGTVTLTDERVIGSVLCARSAAQHGVIERRPVETPFIWSDVTAVRVLGHWAARDAFPRRFATYEGRDLERLERGDLVSVSDDELGLSDAVALVDAVVLSSRRRQQVRVEILDQRVRATG